MPRRKTAHELDRLKDAIRTAYDALRTPQGGGPARARAVLADALGIDPPPPSNPCP